MIVEAELTKAAVFFLVGASLLWFGAAIHISYMFGNYKGYCRALNEVKDILADVEKKINTYEEENNGED